MEFLSVIGAYIVATIRQQVESDEQTNFRKSLKDSILE